MAKFKIKGKKVTGTKKKDKITWQKSWKKSLTVNAGNGNDVINFAKSKYKNVLNGQNGNDTIKGGKKDDKITGGTGNDTIYTGKGTNTVIINKGDGNDTIYHQGKRTNIKVNKALANDKQSFEKKGNDLLLTYTHGGTTTKEVLTFKDYYKGNKNIFLGSQKLENLINTNGLKFSGSGNIQGTNGNDTITGSNINDTISAKGGNDVINAGAGNNTIIFNKDDGSDTIISGGGVDTLVFSNETSIKDLNFSYNDTNLNISANGTTAVLKDFTTGHSAKYVKTGSQTLDISNAIISSDTIQGTEGNDVIIGIGENYQAINGNGGDDVVYCSNEGWSQVVLGDGDDTIYLGNYVGSDSIIYTGSGNNTVHCDGRSYISLGEGDDTVYLKSSAQVWITGRHSSFNGTVSDPVVTNGGNDTIYYDESASGARIRFVKTIYDDLVFTRTGSSDDLVIRYGENNSVTLKDYYKTGNENFSNCIIHALEETDSTEQISNSINNAIINKGGVKYFAEGVTGSSENDYIIGTDGKDIINAGAGNDFIVPKGGDDEINLDLGDDILLAGSGNKNINAYVGNNIIYLGSGNNTVTLGTGSDIIHSGNGENTIKFVYGDNDNDTYNYAGGTDTLEFLTDKLENLNIDLRDNKKVITKSSDEKSVTINGVNSLTEGVTIKDKVAATSNLFNLNTTIGDTLASSQQTITTGTGNDTIYTSTCNDVVNAGTGNNNIHLQVAESNNNSIYTYANGNDTFILDGVSDFNNLSLYLIDGNILVVYDNDTLKNTVTIKNHSGNTGNITFIAGENTSTLADLIASKDITPTYYCDGNNHTINKSTEEKSARIIGCDEADDITGSNYNDYINGGGGNDVLKGGAGDDTYIIDEDWGEAKVVINDVSGTDTLKIAADEDQINLFFDVNLTKDGDEYVVVNGDAQYSAADLYINSNSDFIFGNAKTSNGVKITNYFTTGNIENIQLTNGEDPIDPKIQFRASSMAQTVANWLKDNEFDSTSAAIANETMQQKKQLLNIYKPTVSSSMKIQGTDGDDVIIGTRAGYQEIKGNGGDDVVYCSNGGESQVVLGDGDDTIYLGNYVGNISRIYTGSGNNTVHCDGRSYISLGKGDDTVYLKSSAQVWITGRHSSFNGTVSDPVVTNGGNDTIYYDESASGARIRFVKTIYDDLVFTRTGSSDDLVIRYGENNSVTLKDYYKTGNENFSNCIIHALEETDSTEQISNSINNAIISKGGAGDDIYNSVDTYRQITISDNGGYDILRVSSAKSYVNFIFNVNKDGTFTEGEDKLIIADSTDFNSWKNSGTISTNVLTINDFDSIERIETTDGYYIDTTKLNALKTDVVNWLNSANGGNGYTDVTAAITNNDSDLATLIAIFNRNSNWNS